MCYVSLAWCQTEISHSNYLRVDTRYTPTHTRISLVSCIESTSAHIRCCTECWMIYGKNSNTSKKKERKKMWNCTLHPQPPLGIVAVDDGTDDGQACDLWAWITRAFNAKRMLNMYNAQQDVFFFVMSLCCWCWLMCCCPRRIVDDDDKTRHPNVGNSDDKNNEQWWRSGNNPLKTHMHATPHIRAFDATTHPGHRVFEISHHLFYGWKNVVLVVGILDILISRAHRP